MKAAISFLVLTGAAVLWALGSEAARPKGKEGSGAFGEPGRTARRVTLAQSSRVVTRRLWAGADVDLSGAVSPDGRFVVHTDWTTGDLATRDLVTGETRRLTHKGTWMQSGEYALGAVVSPDGSRIAYAWAVEGSTQLKLIGADGSAPRVLYQNSEAEYLTPAEWSSDGRLILAQISRKDRTNQIALVSAQDGSVRILKTLDWRSPGKMSLSPDGRYLVYSFPQGEQSSQRDVFVLATDGSREQRLVEHPADDAVLGWAPDGKHVLFTSDRTGSVSAWLIRVTGMSAEASPELLRADVWGMQALGFARNGAYYYGVATATSDVYVAAIDVTAGKLLTPPAKVVERHGGASFGSVDWSPDGRHLVYVSRVPGRKEGRGASQLLIRPVGSGEERTISPGLGMLWPTWSPDGRSILVVGSDQQNRTGLYSVDLQTGQATSVVRNDPGVWVQFPAWSPDGMLVFFQRVGGDTKNAIFARDLATSEEREVYRGDVGIGLAVSPDGTQLLFAAGVGTGSKAPALMTIPTAGGPAREVLRLREGEEPRPVAWTASGLVYRVNYYTPQSARLPLEVWVLVAGRTQPIKVQLASQPLPVPGSERYRVHPDGRRIAFAADTWTRELWVMENFLPGTSRAPGAEVGGRP
ncbi:MAG: PD40 domain-containing protein [Gemmatimonadetes bacterium]|nr:PD40 domain-containing protein [Gemmatimonadota bacterium]